jgi:hypothetical protein
MDFLANGSALARQVFFTTSFSLEFLKARCGGWPAGLGGPRT